MWCYENIYRHIMMWRSRRYRSGCFTPWLMLTTTRWTRDRHPLHRWSTSSKMTSWCFIDVEGDTASQHVGPTANVQPNYKYGSFRYCRNYTYCTVVFAIAETTRTVAAQDGWLGYCLYTQSFLGLDTVLFRTWHGPFQDVVCITIAQPHPEGLHMIVR